MNTGAGFLLIVGGLLLLYTIVTGKFQIVEEAFYKLFEIPGPVSEPTTTTPKTQSEQDKRASDILSSPNIGSLISLPQVFIPDYLRRGADEG